MKPPYALILLVAATTAYGQIANPPTSANITFADGIALEPAQDSDGSMTYDGVSGLKFIKPPFMAPTTNFFALFPHWDPFSVNPLGWIMGTATNSTDDLATLFYFASDGAFWAELGASFGGEISFRTNTAAAATRTNLGLGETSSPTFSNVTVNGNLSVGSLTTTTPSTWALDATETAADTNGILALPSNANVIRLTNNNAISGVSGGVLGAFYYLVNQATNAVTISNVGGITVQGGTPLTLGANQAATLVATGATNASVAARGDLTDVALGGTANTAPSQTADSASSLMTRDLVDAAYTRNFNKYAVYESYNFTTSMLTTIGGSASPSITTGGADTPAWSYRPNNTSDGANNYQALLGPYATLSVGARSQKNWSKKTTLALRIMHIASDGTSRYYYGPVASSWAGGDLAVKGIGFEIVTNSIFAVCHNGTTKTTSAAGVALTNQHLYNIVSESDGTGNVRWWVNGAEQTALTNGPSGVSASSAYGFVTEAVNPTPASATFIVVQGLQLISEL